MKKSLIIMALLTAASAASAQMTPEAWIGNYPSLPSITDIIAYDKDQRNPDPENTNENLLFDIFIEQVDEVSVKGSEMMSKTANAEMGLQKQKILSEKVPATNVTKGQLSKMSKAEQKRVATKSAMGQLAELGLTPADVAKLQSGKMSKAEQQALVSKVMAKKTGGITMEDIEFMEKQNLSDEERATFMQQSGLAESVTAKMKADQKGRLSQEFIQKLQLAQKEMSEASRLWTEKAELKEMRAYGDSLWQHKYASEYNKLLTERQSLQEKMDGKQWDEAHKTGQTAAEVKALEDKLEANTNALYDTENAFYEEYIPLYHRALGGVLDYIRGTMMSAYRNWKSVNDEAYNQTGDSKWMVSNAQIAVPADAYASVLKMIEDYNLNNAETPFHQAQ